MAAFEYLQMLPESGAHTCMQGLEHKIIADEVMHLLCV